MNVINARVSHYIMHHEPPYTRVVQGRPLWQWALPALLEKLVLDHHLAVDDLQLVPIHLTSRDVPAQGLLIRFPGDPRSDDGFAPVFIVADPRPESERNATADAFTALEEATREEVLAALTFLVPRVAAISAVYSPGGVPSLDRTAEGEPVLHWLPLATATILTAMGASPMRVAFRVYPEGVETGLLSEPPNKEYTALEWTPYPNVDPAVLFRRLRLAWDKYMAEDQETAKYILTMCRPHLRLEKFREALEQAGITSKPTPWDLQLP